MVISYICFGTSYWSRFQGSRTIFEFLFGFLNPEGGTVRLSRNVGKNYCSSLHNNPAERSSLLLRGGSLNPRIFSFLDNINIKKFLYVVYM